MPEYEPRAFCCRGCGWKLGESYREAGKRITQLRVLRHPCADMAVFSEGVPTWINYAATQVNDCSVLCEHCGAETGWFANQTAIKDMQERKLKRLHEVIHEPTT